MTFYASLIPNGACQTLSPKVMVGRITAKYKCLARVKDAPYADAAIFPGARVHLINFLWVFLKCSPDLILTLY